VPADRSAQALGSLAGMPAAAARWNTTLAVSALPPLGSSTCGPTSVAWHTAPDLGAQYERAPLVPFYTAVFDTAHCMKPTHEFGMHTAVGGPSQRRVAGNKPAGSHLCTLSGQMRGVCQSCESLLFEEVSAPRPHSGIEVVAGALPKLHVVAL